MERRQENEDRRGIARISSPIIRDNFKVIRRSIHFLLVLSFAMAVLAIIRSFVQGVVGMGPAIFQATVYVLAVGVFYRYSKGIGFYLENESVSNLERAMESQVVLWVAMCLLCSLQVIINFIT